MSSPRRLAAASIGATLLIGAAGCQSSSPPTQGSTVKPYDTDMPTLPKDENAAKAVVRAMVMKEAIVLLKASGVKYTGAQFDVPISFDDDNNAKNGDLQIWFRRVPTSSSKP